MAEAYRAKDTRLDRTVAIKILSVQLSENANMKQRFKREARTISSLSHPTAVLFTISGQQAPITVVLNWTADLKHDSRILPIYEVLL